MNLQLIVIGRPVQSSHTCLIGPLRCTARNTAVSSRLSIKIRRERASEGGLGYIFQPVFPKK